MGSESFPVIRLEVDRMRHAIMVAINQHLDAEKETISVLVEQEIKAFNFGAVIREQTSIVLREMTKRAVESLQWDDGVREKVRGIVRAELLREAGSQHGH